MKGIECVGLQGDEVPILSASTSCGKVRTGSAVDVVRVFKVGSAAVRRTGPRSICCGTSIRSLIPGVRSGSWSLMTGSGGANRKSLGVIATAFDAIIYPAHALESAHAASPGQQLPSCLH